jgi:glutamate-1-semialdehyde 2,1-aminomutase
LNTTMHTSTIGAELLAEYAAQTVCSRELTDRLSASLPGGETRNVTHYWPYPLAIREASGSHVTDVDGNQYLDLVNNMASLVHGHRFAPIVNAAKSVLATVGTVQAGPTWHQLQMAELLVERYPAAEMVRFTNSGSEAALLAARLVRRVTGRSRIIAMKGGYHGLAFHDPSPDVTRVAINDEEELAGAVDDTVAAIFVEPFLGNAGVIPASPGFLEHAQSLARKHQALFVMDEVQALRVNYAGYHGASGLDPDLVLMGKMVGGGFPVGVLAGRTMYLELLSAKRSDVLVHSGTFNGNVMTCAAGWEAMRYLDGGAIDRLNAFGAELANRLAESGRAAKLPLVVTRAGSILCIHFMEVPPTNAAEARPTHEAAKWFHLAAMMEGVNVPYGGRLYLSTAVTSDEMEFASEALSRAVSRLGQMFSGELDSRSAISA